MHSDGYNWRREPRGIAFSSVLLLAIHICAAAFIVGMVIARPWADDPVPAAVVEENAPAETDAPAVTEPTPAPVP